MYLMWKNDIYSKYKVNEEIVKRYFNVHQILNFGEDSARKEEQALMPYINITKESAVLDLGCGNGRWAKILSPRCKTYVGIDFSENFIKVCKKNVNADNCIFVCDKVQDYFFNRKFDLILIIGLMTYMNDSDIDKMVRHCKSMLVRDGTLIVRNVNSIGTRKFYNKNLSLFQRLRKVPGYQVIRRTKDQEMVFFSSFDLVYDNDIEDTGYHFYVFKNKGG